MPIHHLEYKHRNTDEFQREKIVDHLLVILYISPYGDDYVSFFGIGTEPSNREAMITWMNHLNYDVDIDKAEKRLRLQAKKTRLSLMKQEII